MPQNENKTSDELREVARTLLAIADEIDGENEPEPRVPASISEVVAEKTAAKRCLQCGKVKDEPYRRGLCAKDYMASQRQVAGRKTTWASLMVAGLAGPKGSPGRPRDRTPLDDFIEGKTPPDLDRQAIVDRGALADAAAGITAETPPAVIEQNTDKPPGKPAKTRGKK